MESAEDYLRNHHIEELLESIVTSLLENRPSNPRKHIASLMNENVRFPSKIAASNENAASNDVQKQTTVVVPNKTENQAQAEKVENKPQQVPFPSRKSASQTATFRQQAFPAAEAVPFPSRNTGNERAAQGGFTPRYNQAESFIGTRRFSAVSAEALIKSRDFRRKAFSSKSISNTTMTIPVHKKTPEETETIKSIIKKVSFLSFLKQEQVTALVNAMFEKKYKAGDVIIKQGDMADNFYILQEGVVDIFKKGENDTEEKKITELGVGSYFGELALMSGGRRAATVSAHTDCRCWAIDQTTYLYLLRDLHYQRRQKCREIIAKVPLLAGLPDYEALLVAESLVVEDYASNTVLVKQGEKGDKFYLIIDGDADVLINDKKVNTLHTGSYFGELALIYDASRAATVVSTTEIKVAFITGEMFRKILDKCSSTFKANEQSYHNKQN